MATQTDVKAVSASATGNLGIGGTPNLGVRIKGVYCSATTGGTVALSDVVNAAETYLTFVVPVGAVYMLLPGEGIRTDNDVKLTLTTTVGTVTVFYG
jgi:hypothetical protein